MSPTETKAKIRPQQSCLKCRERKVKCDRNIPCEACIHRGIESECTYLTSAEDRAHISQAEIIDRLRREVAQLRTQLNQSSARGPSPSRRDKVYARKHKSAALRGSYTAASGPGSSGSGSGSRSATGSAEPTEAGSWAGSSPSSISTTTRTNSVTVTSPDSTGSDSGAGGYVQQHTYPGSTGAYGSQIAEVDLATATDNTALRSYLNDDTMAQYHAGNLPAFAPKIPGSIPMQGPPSQTMHPTPEEGLPGLHMYGDQNSPGYDPNSAHAQTQSHMASYATGGEYSHNLYDYTTMNTFKHNPSQTYPQPWSQGHSFPQPQSQSQIPLQPQSHAYPESTYYSSNMHTFPHAESTIYPHPQPQPHSFQTTNPPQPYSPPTHPTDYQTHAINSIPDSWKGPDKQALLETLLETITSCDEERVAQVVAVVRTSETPEDAVSGICQVLGIGDGAGSSMR